MSSASSGNGGRRVLRIGKYEVQNYIATGGMGAVYKAVDVDLGRLVALKILQSDLAEKPRVVERFRREARSAARLNHKNIVTVYEFAEVNGTFLLALEYVAGTDLHEYVMRQGRLAPLEARRFTYQAAKALAHAHTQGIVHRDIKPSNFLLAQKDGKPYIKLTDFGLARAVGQDELPNTKVSPTTGPADYVARLTTLGTTVGTVDYMSPEQARNSAAADIRSDIYSLGCTLYFMLTGDCPFPDGTPSQRILKHCEETPPDVRLISPDVPPGLVLVLERMLAKNPDDRYQTPQELIKDLEDIEGLRPPTTLGAKPGPPPLPQTGPPPLPTAVRPPLPQEGPPPLPAALAGSAAPPGRKPPSTGEMGRSQAKPASSVDWDWDDEDESEEESSEETVATAPGSKAGWLWGTVALGVLVLAGAGIVMLNRPSEPPQEDKGSQVAVEITKKEEAAPPPKIQPATPVEPPANVFPITSLLPHLFQPSRPLVLEALHEEYEGPLANLATPAAGTVVYRVSRTPREEPNTFRSLAEACAKVPPDQATVIEIHDNGPLFEGSLPTLAHRNIIVRPGKGYRPLLAWDAGAVPGGGADPKRAGRFMALDRGSLALEDLDVVFKADVGNFAEAPVLFQVSGGTLTAWKCSFSTTGNHPQGVVVIRLDTMDLPTKCRLRRCYARGPNLTAISVSGSDAEVLVDGCLLVGDDQPLLHVMAREDAWAKFRVVRSTLVAGKALLRVDRADDKQAAPRLLWRGWDSLLTRGGLQTPGDLLVLGDGVRPGKMNWRVVNCLYAGWRNLLSEGANSIDGSNVAEWDRRWANPEGDKALPKAWPETAPAPLELMPPITYQTTGTPVHFAATGHAGPLGCDVSVLPAGRPAWPKRTYDLFDFAPITLSEAVVPDKGAAADGLYLGEQVDLGKVDLGKYLETVLKTKKPAPRVFLHLYGTNPRLSSPIRVRGFDLVLYFVRVNPKVDPPTLFASPAVVREGDALIEVEDGGLLVVDGKVSVAGLKSSALPKHLLKVRGGNVRLMRCRLSGPLGADTGAYQSLIDFQGAGEEAADEPRACAISDCILQSGKPILQLRGTGARVQLHNNVAIGGDDFLRFDFGANPSPRLNIQCALEHNTVAVRRSVLYLPDTPNVPAVTLPVVVRADANLVLDPFGAMARQSSLLRFQGQPIPRGVLLWQGMGNAYDERLHASALADDAAGAALPLKAWTPLWGTPGDRNPYWLDLPSNPKTTFTLEQLRLDRLTLPPAIRARFGAAVPGADLTKVGVPKKLPTP
jgi:serine/threonine-protein kinase